ncbi:hypothetical protein Tdes44962_MAKER08627 [Teratosphaeria destructans]|uniref:Uncharacterized protein n=1 Tax=Teratosphaeria destructans TaxID=418781 RepID=A0A9W7W4Q2_9PEZI|nr:hypothetical protein Tdes44962_MAKER08627 [Teratosphaeria destructans]
MRPLTLLPFLASLAWAEWNCTLAVPGSGAPGACFPSGYDADIGGQPVPCRAEFPCKQQDHQCNPFDVPGYSKGLAFCSEP